MNKCFILGAGENWIIDVMKKRFEEENSDLCTANIVDANILWLLADFNWSHIPRRFLQSKKVIATIHHIVPEKWNEQAQNDFNDRDQYADVYTVFNDTELTRVSSMTKKPVKLLPYWADTRLWQSATRTKVESRTFINSSSYAKNSVPINAYVILSAQRDTEGAGIDKGLFLPKLEKGPDKLANALIKLHSQNPNIHVLLGGWRRQYIIQRLNEVNVPYTYFELPSQGFLREMYNACDEYFVTSRYEGAPQSILECGMLGVHMRSTPCGIASQLLPLSAINDDVTLATPSVPDVRNAKVLGNVNYDMTIPNGFMLYRELIQTL